MSCLNEDRLQSILFDASPIAVSESLHLRTCVSCSRLNRELLSVHATLEDSGLSTMESSFEIAVRSREISRKIAPILEDRRIRLHLYKVWGAIACALLLVAFPTESISINGLLGEFGNWVQNESAFVQSFWSNKIASFSEATLLIVFATVFVFLSDLLNLRRPRRARA